MKCYVCGKGNLEHKKMPFSMYGIRLGTFDAETCPACNEIFFTEESSDKIDTIAKKKGLFGLEAKTKIGKVGNSIDVKISKRLAEFAGLKKGEEVRIYPEGKKKLVIETG
ncbi:MAG: hypothetical protein ABIJ21_01625 [Nanoarchaeota archaeon]